MKPLDKESFLWQKKINGKRSLVPPFTPAEWHIFLVISHIGLNGMSGTSDYQTNRSIWPGVFTERNEIMKSSPSLSCKALTMLYFGSQWEFLVNVTDPALYQQTADCGAGYKSDRAVFNSVIMKRKIIENRSYSL